MNILVIGNGGREHALCWKIAQSPLVNKLYCAQGNPGTAKVAENVNIHHSDEYGIRQFCLDNGVGLVVIGPEAPLVAGLADVLRQAGIAVFGPGRGGAQLEGSKGFMKDLCTKAGVATARYQRCTTLEQAEAFLETLTPPIVVKADGLAAGKGVYICASHLEADRACKALLSDQILGAAGQELILEEFLDGYEVSFFALCDGQDIMPFMTAQDYKRAFDGDQGPNTGGMGAISPATGWNDGMTDKVMQQVIRPVVDALNAQGCPYQGVLYAGLMVTPQGIKVLEFNARFGDPECQVLVRRLQSDIVPLLLAVANGTLATVAAPVWDPRPALTVVMANEGYPASPKPGSVIRHIPADTGQVVTFHAGTETDFRDHALLATGGRVLNITAIAASLPQARDAAYQAVDAVIWPEGFCRRDIGLNR